MSTAYIIGFQDGKAATQTGFGNSWGGAAYIWNYLWDKYCKREEYDTWITPKNAERLWALGKDERLSEVERNVLRATFDGAIVKRENFERFAKDLRAFVELVNNSKIVCHLGGWAYFAEHHPEYEAIAFWHTSVCENPWMVGLRACPGEDEIVDHRPYDLNLDHKHFELYS